MRKAVTTNKICSSLFLSFVCFTAVGFADASPEVESEDLAPKHMRAGVRHIENKGIGYNTGYTTVEGFFATDPSTMRVMPFLDLRGHVFDDGRLAANAGLGIRSRLGCRVYGLNAYYDYRKTRRQHYNQVGAGLETLGTLWDFRINGYLPVGEKRSHAYHVAFEEFSGNQAIIRRKFEYALKGANAEVGFHIWKNKDFSFYGAAGPYYLSGAFDHGWGGKARLMGKFREYLTLEISDSYDSVFHNRLQGEIGIRIPFGPRSTVKRTKSSCFNNDSFASMITERMVEPVFRHEIIPVKKHTQHRAAINPATGLPYFFVFVDNTSSSLGTFESPYPTLAEAQVNSKPNDVIYVFPGDGTTMGMDDGIILQTAQRFWGSSTAQELPTTFGAIIINPHSTTAPLITGLASDVVTIANTNEVIGFTIQNIGGDGISAPAGTPVINLTAKNNQIQGIGTDFGLNLTNVSGTVLVANNTIVNQDVGIEISSNSIQGAQYFIANNSITTSARGIRCHLIDCTGIAATTSGNAVTATNNAVVLELDNAADLPSNSLAFANNQLTSGNIAVEIELKNEANAAISFTSNTVISTANKGIRYRGNDDSEATFAVSQNNINALDVALDIRTSNSNQLFTAIANNQLAGQSFPPIVIGSIDNSIFTGSISNNTLSCQDPVQGLIQFIAGNASLMDLGIVGNTFNGSATGISGGSLGTSSQMTATIQNNTFNDNTDFGLTLTTANTAASDWHVKNNTFNSSTSAQAAAWVSSTGGTACLEFLSNTASPTSGYQQFSGEAFQFTQSAGTFQLEPLSGNIGTVLRTGTITDVPAGTCE